MAHCFLEVCANTNANGKHCIMDPVAEHVNKRIVERKEYRELDDFEGETHDINSDLGIQPTKCRRNIANRVNAV